MSGRPQGLGALAHPVALAAISVLILNDHVFKETSPGVVTGKLSDVAGLVFFPLLLISVVELVTGRRSTSSIIVAIACTGVVFASIQVWEPAADVYRYAMGYVRLPLRYVFANATSVVPVEHTADVTDLLALPALLVAWRLGAHGSFRKMKSDLPTGLVSSQTGRESLGITG